MNSESSEIQSIVLRLREFADNRDWEQFHSPKNLSMALAVEAGELMEIFQWLPQEDSRKLEEKDMSKAAAEIADVAIYLIRLSDVMGIDLLDTIKAKIDRNEEKYPIDKARGNSKKYTDF
jgi:dCTP diphosphatase